MRIAVIGGGAAGSFCAIELKRRLPSARVEVFEAGRKALAKVALTGGGRCNVTNSFEGISKLEQAYPRGAKLLKRVFRSFDHEDCREWFEREGIKLVLQEDHCVFPASQDAMEIVRLLLLRMRQLGVETHLGRRVTQVCPLATGSAGTATLDEPLREVEAQDEDGLAAPEPGVWPSRGKSGNGDCPQARFLLRFDGFEDVEADAVVVATGGSPRLEGLRMLDSLGLEIEPPVPSLFSFNLEDSGVRQLMGTVVENATASIPGTGLKASGPLLVTHWGMSGPAVLKLSSYAARHLAPLGSRTVISVNWTGTSNEQALRQKLEELARTSPQRQVSGCHLEGIPSRLWKFLSTRSGIREDARWAELGSKGMNRLVNTLMNDSYKTSGKSKVNEEFVTCGGVALGNIDPNTLECKRHKGLYFAGEVLDIDGITGGFNLQAAWSTGWLAAKSIAASKEGSKQGSEEEACGGEEELSTRQTARQRVSKI